VLPVLVVVLAVCGVYVQALGGPFLWDDRLLVLDAPLIEKGAALGEYLRQPFWMAVGARPASVSYYRPLVTLTFALDHRLHGSNSGGYHLTNIVLHLVCALLLLALLRRRGVGAATATLVTTAWALLPRLAEAAAWISGRTDLLATLWSLLALLVWGPSWARRGGAALCLLLGLLAKESALAVLPALAAAEWVGLGSLSVGRRARTVARSVAPLGLAVAFYLGLRFWAIGYRNETLPLGAWGRTLTVLQSAGTYVEMLFDAWRPRAVIGRVGANSMATMLLGALALVVAPLAAWRFRNHWSPMSALGSTLAAAAVVPVLHLVPIPLRTLAADRFLYLPTAGLALGLASGLERALGKVPWRWGAIVALVGSLGVAAFQRVGVWSDETEFWVRTYLETPRTNNAAAIELFGVYYRAALYRDALQLSERALAYDDTAKKDPLHNSALCLSHLGQRAAAAERFRASRGRRPSNADVDVLLAVLAVQGGEGETARPSLEHWAKAGDPSARWLLARLPDLVQARNDLVALGPAGDPERRARLATLLGDDSSAIRAWREVVDRSSTSRETLHDALLYLVRTGYARTIDRAARAYRARFGALEPDLQGIVDLRLAELERLMALRPRLGLASGAVRDAARD
jgi:tetratricopeptide (TPR) repeat protein